MDCFSNAMKRTLATVFLCLLLASPAGAGFDEGWAAYERGDYATALREWRPLANQGHANAQYNLGTMYDKGQGVPQDYAAAVKWYRKAANQGNDAAQSNLGYMYAKGQGVVQDYVRAHMWFNIAASRGNKSVVENRDIVAKKMPPAQIAEAQRMARDWVAAFNKRKGK